MIHPTHSARRHWRATVAPFALMAALIASPAVAQDTTQNPTPASANGTAPAADDKNAPEIVVTGTLLRQFGGATASPVTTVTA
ncbi:hypothetical protein ACSTHF_23290, partial [Vibrio parahaemolyticus]